MRVGLHFQSRPAVSSGQSVKFTAVLGAEPTAEAGRQTFRLGEYRVIAPLFPEFHFGDKVEVEGVADCYRGDCGRPALRYPHLTLRGDQSFNPWVKAAQVIKSKFIGIYRNSLGYQEAELLSGIVLGSSGLSRDFKDKLARVGLSHIVAASGMNVTILSGVVFWFLSTMRWHRRYIALLGMVTILFYATITGFEPPIVRAVIMAGTAILAGLLGRQSSVLNALLMSGYVMLWVSPGLVVEPSFLLSFSSMIGQVVLSTPRLKLPEAVGAVIEPVVKDIWQSLAAIVLTFPIVLMFFSKFSLVALFANVLVLWVVEPLMILGGLAGIAGLASAELVRYLISPASVLLNFFLKVVEVFSKDERWLLKITEPNWTFVLGYYLVLGAVIWWWKERASRQEATVIKG